MCATSHERQNLDRLALSLRKQGLSPERRVPMAEFCTFRIGGPAELFVRVSTPETLVAAVEASSRHGVPCLLIGGGSNILVRDGGFPGLVIKDETRGRRIENGFLEAASGEILSDLVRDLAGRGIGGLEFLAGIPGTLGGAICGNAGAWGRDISESLLSVEIASMGTGRIDTVEPGRLCFSYRSSLIKEQRPSRERTGPAAIITGAVIKLDMSPDDNPSEAVERILETRSGRLPPPEYGCAGSYFKNLPPERPGGRRRPAGALLEAVGAKGLSRGDAQVYEGHANIIVNRGSARAADVLALADEMKRRVRERFSVELQPEVQTVGED